MRTTPETHTNVFWYATRTEKNKSEKELPKIIQVVFQAAMISEYVLFLILVTWICFHRLREDSDDNQKQEIKHMNENGNLLLPWTTYFVDRFFYERFGICIRPSRSLLKMPMRNWGIFSFWK